MANWKWEIKGVTPVLPTNPEMVERTPHPGPLPIGSADSADAERENRSQRLGKVVQQVVQGFYERKIFGAFTSKCR
jgi:hypothetical protein